MDTNDTLLLILSELKDLKQGQQEIKQHLEKHDGQLAAIAEAVNISNSALNSKIDTLDKKFDERFNILESRTNINTIDINKLRAAQ